MTAQCSSLISGYFDVSFSVSCFFHDCFIYGSPNLYFHKVHLKLFSSYVESLLLCGGCEFDCGRTDIFWVVCVCVILWFSSSRDPTDHRRNCVRSIVCFNVSEWTKIKWNIPISFCRRQHYHKPHHHHQLRRLLFDHKWLHKLVRQKLFCRWFWRDWLRTGREGWWLLNRPTPLPHTHTHTTLPHIQAVTNCLCVCECARARLLFLILAHVAECLCLILPLLSLPPPHLSPSFFH